MASSFFVEIATPGRKLGRKEATRVLLPAYDGEIGILPGHRDFAGLLGTGVMKLATPQGAESIMVSSGLWEVRNNNLTILAEVAEEGQEINSSEALSRILNLERNAPVPNLFNADYQAYELSLARARARSEASGTKG